MVVIKTNLKFNRANLSKDTKIITFDFIENYMGSQIKGSHMDFVLMSLGLREI